MYRLKSYEDLGLARLVDHVVRTVVNGKSLGVVDKEYLLAHALTMTSLLGLLCRYSVGTSLHVPYILLSRLRVNE